jgi:hypothetical protein
MARDLDCSETPVRQSMYGRTYQDHPTPPRELPSEPAFYRHNKRPDNAEILRRHEKDGKRPYEIARELGVSRGCIVSAIRRAKDARALKNTSPSDARPSRPDRGASAPSHSTKVHSGGGVAHSGKTLSRAKANGGRKTAKTARNYYATFGGKSGDHERARQAAQQANTDAGTCAACHSAPASTSGLCTTCDGLVQRASPAAAYGAEPGNLSRTSSGLEADNIVTAEPEAA